jgi:hypothetical protein
MRTTVEQQGRESIAQGRGCVVDGKYREGQLPVPVVLASVGLKVQRIAGDTLARSLAWVFLCYAETRMRHNPCT